MSGNDRIADMNEDGPALTAARKILEKHGIHARKNFGQNFIIDPFVISKTINAANVGSLDTVIEIGPGLGALTSALAQNAKKVIAVEIDQNLIPVLKENLSEYKNIEIINADFLKLDLDELFRGEKSVKVVANLPFYITSPIIMSLFEKRGNISSITIMLQKEAADRLRAQKGSKSYGIMPIAVNYYTDVYLAANVPSNCFHPRPDVDSVILRLDVLNPPRVSVSDEIKMFSIIKTAFSMRRKTLVNCLSSNEVLGLSREAAVLAVQKAGLSSDIRGENLSLSDFAALTEAVLER